MKIGIIGLGLIGGSILKNLVEKEHEIYVVTRNTETLDKIKNIVKYCSSDYNILKPCEVVFVCTPINKILESLDKLDEIVSENCFVTDVASVKGFLTNKKRKYKFIPSHPMAGTENSGYDFSYKELFVGAKWVLTPFDNNETDILVSLIKEMGAIPIVTTAKEHDEAVAIISHLPMYISQCLFKSAKDNNLAMTLASSGFRDTTRLAMTNLDLAKDMMSFNTDNINNCMQIFINELNNFKNDYKDENIIELQQKRKKMYSNDGKNIY